MARDVTKASQRNNPLPAALKASQTRNGRIPDCRMVLKIQIVSDGQKQGTLEAESDRAAGIEVAGDLLGEVGNVLALMRDVESHASLASSPSEVAQLNGADLRTVNR